MRRESALDGKVGPPLVDEEPADATGPRVEVLVCAPDRKVDVPIVQRQRDVSYAMRKVPAAHAALYSTESYSALRSIPVHEILHALARAAEVISFIAKYWPV